MRRTVRVPVKRGRAAQRKTIHEIAADMEDPLNVAIDLVGALDLIGLGLYSLDDDAANPILTLARLMSEHLHDLKEKWSALA